MISEPAPVQAPADLFDLTGRIAVVTGASSGLGARFVKVLLAAGASVVAGARRLDRLEQLRAGDESGRLDVDRLDVVDRDSIEAFVSSAVRRHGKIDILVNNAGITSQHDAAEEPGEAWSAAFDVNVHGLFRMTQEVGRHMIARESGTVINLASISGMVASSPFNSASYCATKGAVVNLTRELAVQWARRGIRVNALAPGWILTEMNAAMPESDQAMAYQRRNCPMGRWADPGEMDGALLFLASDASSYCTGQTLLVDGGWTAR